MKRKGIYIYIYIYMGRGAGGKHRGKMKRTHHGSISLGSALQIVCSPYTYQRMANFCFSDHD